MSRVPAESTRAPKRGRDQEPASRTFPLDRPATRTIAFKRAVIKDSSKPARMRIEAELRHEPKFAEKVCEEKYITEIEVNTERGDYWLFFYGDATFVRSPQDLKAKMIPVQMEIRDKTEAPDLEKQPPDEAPEHIIFASGRNNHLTPGLYIQRDGKIIITRPEPGWNIEVISHGNPYDLATNTKCHP